MPHILSNLTEEYQTIVEIPEDKLYDKYNPLTIERTHDNILSKFDQTNKQLGPRTSREDERFLYVKSQFMGACKTCGKYGHKGKYFWNKEGVTHTNMSLV